MGSCAEDVSDTVVAQDDVRLFCVIGTGDKLSKQKCFTSVDSNIVRQIHTKMVAVSSF